MCRSIELLSVVLLLVNSLVPSPGGCAQTNSVPATENVPEQRPSLNDLLRELTEAVRQRMPCGVPQLGIPALVPFRWDRIRLDTGERFWMRFDGELVDGITVGLDQFNVSSLDVQLLTLQLDFSALFPVVRTAGKYKARGQLIGFIPFDRAGSFSMELFGLTVQGSVRFAIEGKHFIVRELKLVPSVQSSRAHFEKIMPLAWANSMFDRSVSETIPGYVQENRHSMAAKMEATLKPRLNAQLRKYDAKDILGLINRGNWRFNSC